MIKIKLIALLPIVLFHFQITAQTSFKTPGMPPYSEVEREPFSPEEICRKIAEKESLRKVSSDASGHVKAKIGSITVYKNNLFYKLKINNSSNLSFDIDFIKFFVRDLKNAKRTATQEKEIYPKYFHGIAQTTVEGNSSAVFVFMIDKFPMSQSQALFIEIYEKSGARHLYLKVRNKNINNASVL